MFEFMNHRRKSLHPSIMCIFHLIFFDNFFQSFSSFFLSFCLIMDFSIETFLFHLTVSCYFYTMEWNKYKSYRYPRYGLKV